MVSIGSIAGGAAGGAVVNIVIRAVDQFSSNINKAKKQMGGLSRASRGLTGALAGATAGAFALGSAIVGVTINAAKELQPIQNSFNNLFGKEGPKALENLRRATRGTVSDIDLMRQANQALLLGIDPEALPAMFEGAFAAAQATGRPIASAIEDITTGIGRQSKLILDNLGIQVDTEKAYSDYAETLRATRIEQMGLSDATIAAKRSRLEELENIEDLAGSSLFRTSALNQEKTALEDLLDSIDNVNVELTEQEKKAAFTAATMEALAANQEKLGEIEDNLAIKTQQANAAIQNQSASFGQELMPILDETIASLQPAMETFGQVMIDIVLPAIKFAAQAFGDLLQKMGDTGMLENLIKALGYVFQGLFVILGLVFKAIETFVDFSVVIQQWAIIMRDNVANYFKAAWLGMQLVFGRVANFVIDGLQNMLDTAVNVINGIIRAANKVPGINIGLASAPDLSRFRFDTAAIEDELLTLRAEAGGRPGGNLIQIQIDTLQGLDPDAVAQSLQRQLDKFLPTA